MNVSLWSGGRITFGKSFKRINKKAKIVNRNGNYTGLSVFLFLFSLYNCREVGASAYMFLGEWFVMVVGGGGGGGVSKNTVEILAEHIVEERIFTIKFADY